MHTLGLRLVREALLERGRQRRVGERLEALGVRARPVRQSAAAGAHARVVAQARLVQVRERQRLLAADALLLHAHNTMALQSILLQLL